MKSISLPRLSSCSIAVLMVLASSPSALAASKGFVLVQEGRPKATIVTAAKPSENAAAAARELQHYVRKMSGAELPILIDEQETTGPVILVGASRFTEKLPDLKIPSGLTPQLREEGFVVQCRGDRLVLAGNDAGPYFGTRYAVVELLHRLGVRWFMPGEFGEVIPQTRTVSISEMEVRQRPDFTMRNYWQHARDNMAKEDYEWKIHHKMNPKMQDWFGVPGDSSIRGYMPGKEVFKAHPDWFALQRDGQDVKQEFRFRHKDRSECLALISAAPVRADNGEFKGSLWMVADLSGRQCLEIELADTQKKSEAQARDLTAELNKTRKARHPQAERCSQHQVRSGQ